MGIGNENVGDGMPVGTLQTDGKSMEFKLESQLDDICKENARNMDVNWTDISLVTGATANKWNV